MDKVWAVLEEVLAGALGLGGVGACAQAPAASHVAASTQPRIWVPGWCAAKRKPGKYRMLISRLSPGGADHDLTTQRFPVTLVLHLSCVSWLSKTMPCCWRW